TQESRRPRSASVAGRKSTVPPESGIGRGERPGFAGHLSASFLPFVQVRRDPIALAGGVRQDRGVVSYDNVFPLQPPIRLPSEEELAAEVRAAPLAAEFLDDQEDVLSAWGEVCRDRLDEVLLLEVVRLFVAREPAAGEPP